MIAEISPANYGRARAATPTTVRIGGTEPVQYRARGKSRGRTEELPRWGSRGGKMIAHPGESDALRSGADVVSSTMKRTDLKGAE